MSSRKNHTSLLTLSDWIRTHQQTVFLSLLFLTLITRLYKLQTPLADWHSWRQADTASVTREYVKHGVDLLHPTYHDLSTIPNNLDNTAHGYRMVELPIINAMIATIVRTFPQLPLVPTSRLFSAIFSLGTAIGLWYLTSNIFGKKQAILTLLTFALLPYSVYYSRVVLPEPYVVTFSTLSIATFLKWSREENYLWIIVSGILLSLSLVLKPFVIFLAPIYATLLLWKVTKFRNFSLNTVISSITKSLPSLIVFFVIAFLPLYLWRDWIQQYPEGIPASDWLFNSNGIRWRPAWFRWLGYERLTKLILGFFGLLFLPFSVLTKSTDRKLKGLTWLISLPNILINSWWFSIFLYFSVIATGNVQHDYYQSLLIPIVSLSVGVGAWNLYVLLKRLSSTKVALLAVCGVYLLMLYFSWQQVKGYYNINHWEYVEAGQAVDRLTPVDAKVIAPAFGDTQFLFQTNRTGWPIGTEIEDKIEKGATHYVTTTYDDEAKQLEEEYTVVEKNEKFLILKLQ